MSQNEQGVLYPFRLTGSRMRQSAVQLRRQGNVLDALALVRRAAEQDDTPAGWQTLAAELRQMGNWEAAVRLLARTLSQSPHHSGAWMDMARCLHALGQDALAVDCAYHQLQEDPWSAEGDAARSFLAETDTLAEGKEPGRVQRLAQKGLAAWQSGDRAAGERCVRRALRLTDDKERLLVTAAMLCMLEMDLTGALKYLPRALRCNPEDPRTLTALATLYHQLGKRRMSRAFLKKAGMYADSVMAEDGFLSAAWAQDAWGEMADYLTARMKRQPHRIALLSAQATMCGEQGNLTGAQALWREILAIDPDDRQAATLIAWSQTQPQLFINVPGLLPRMERQRQMTELRMAGESLAAAELLCHGSRSRRLVDWALESIDTSERRLAMELLERADGPAVIAYLKELLCRPFLNMEAHQWALVRLAEMGCREEMLMMAGPHYTLVQCQALDEKKPRQPWRIFLPLLLQETRRYGASNAIADFAASLWRCMTHSQRMDAAGPGRLVWCKAMEILYLRMTGREERAATVALHTPLSPRRISRVLRQLGRTLEAETVTEVSGS